MSVTGVDEDKQNLKAQLSQVAGAVENAQSSLKLGESAQKILEELTKSSDKVFDHAMELITKIRRNCDHAETAIKTKREDVRTSMKAYVESLQVVANISEDAHKALGEVMLQGDRIGGG